MIRVKAQEEKWVLSDKDAVKGGGDMIDSFQWLMQTRHEVILKCEEIILFYLEKKVKYKDDAVWRSSSLLLDEPVEKEYWLNCPWIA